LNIKEKEYNMEILYFDVVTIGAGGGGCIAAITASEQGAKVDKLIIYLLCDCLLRSRKM
jgi:tRNA U34 5-carboxymethylaminomethyl modifying enzyme MnmG/GidA